MKDIDRFSESLLSEQFRNTFFLGLPTHIRDKVSWRGGGGAVLQGYRGPDNLRDIASGYSETLDPSYGVQEIQFFHAVSKIMNAIPLLGTVIFGITRLVEYAADHSDWVSAFFDETSGDILTDSQAQENISKNKSAENHYNEGVKYEKENHHEKAIVAFQKACDACTRGYKNEALFLSCKQRVQNMRASQLDAQGNQHENNKRYQEAFDSFKKAHETCADNCEHKDHYKANQDRAELYWRNGERNSRANDLHDNAKSLSSSRNYKQAVIKFNESLNEAVDNSLKAAIMKSKSETLNEWATQLENIGDIDGALVKFRESLESVVDETSRRQVEANVTRMEEIILQNKVAEKHYEEGVQYESQIRFEAARDAFQKAYDACTREYKNKALFLNCKQRVQNIRASHLDAQGNQHENNQRYQEAFEMYKKAFETCADICESKDLYKRKQDRAEINWAAQLEKNGDIEGAIRKYKDAVNSAVNETDKKKFETCLLKAEAQALYKKASELWNDAWKAEDKGEEDKAKAKFWQLSSLLIQASNMDPTNGNYKRLLNMCKLKIEGNALFNEGLMLQVEACRLKHQQKYEEAQSKYREALDKFQDGYKSTGNDEKFKSCINFITEVINAVSNTVEALTPEEAHMDNISQSADDSDFERDFIQTIGMISRLGL